MLLTTLCFIKKNGKTLMIHRIKRKEDMQFGKWNFIGGKMEANESPEECVIREVKEETGLTIKSPALKGIITFPENGNNQLEYTFVFVATEFSGKEVESDEGKIEWIEDSKIMSLNLHTADKFFVPLIEKKGVFSSKIIYQGTTAIRQVAAFY